MMVRKRGRRSIRLRGYDYTQTGAYFVTICTQYREHLFGEVVNGEMELNTYGRVVATFWQRIPRHFARVELDEWVVMPNHMHGIIVITDGGGGGDGRGESPRASPDVDRGRGEASRESPDVDRGEASRESPDVERRGSTGEAHFTSRPISGDASSQRSKSVSGDASPQRRGDSRPIGPSSGSLGAIVGNFKSVTTRRINRIRKTPGARVWQRNYYERVIRDERALHAIRRYIRNNPGNWSDDHENLVEENNRAT